MATTRTAILVSALILLVSTSSANGQILDANGCLIEGAFYNEVSEKCECKEGYDGVGDICCTPISDNDVCFLTGDPFLRSITNQIVTLNIPCSVCINVMSGQTQSNKKCVWEVLSSSTIQEQGAMYSSQVTIAVSVNRKSPTYFLFDGTSILDPVTKQPMNLGPDGKASTTVDDETIRLAYASSAGLWTIEGCGNKVIFRPKLEGNSGKPGVCMLAAKDSTEMSLQQGNLCNLKSTFASTPWKYGVLDSALNMRQNFNAIQKASHPDYAETCSQVDDLMSTLCQGISEEAMAKCAPLLYHGDIRYCLDRAGVKGQAIVGLFQKCLASYCDGEKSFCDDLKSVEALQKCVPSLTDCDQWPYYFEF